MSSFFFLKQLASSLLLLPRQPWQEDAQQLLVISSQIIHQQSNQKVIRVFCYSFSERHILIGDNVIFHVVTKRRGRFNRVGLCIVHLYNYSTHSDVSPTSTAFIRRWRFSHTTHVKVFITAGRTSLASGPWPHHSPHVFTLRYWRVMSKHIRAPCLSLQVHDRLVVGEQIVTLMQGSRDVDRQRKRWQISADEIDPPICECVAPFVLMHSNYFKVWLMMWGDAVLLSCSFIQVIKEMLLNQHEYFSYLYMWNVALRFVH